MPNPGWISVDSVVNDYLLESEQSPSHKYYKCYQLAIRGLQELGLDFFYTLRTVELTISSTKTADIPADYLNYSKVGVANGRGEIIPLAYNSNLSTFNDLRSNRRASVAAPSLMPEGLYDGCSVFCNYWDGEGLCDIYGVPGGAPFIGSFRVDTENNVIVFDLDFNYPSVFLEYVSAPSELGEQYLPMVFKQPLISYIGWKDIISLPPSRRGGLGDKKQREDQFYNDRRLAVARWKPLRLDQKYIWSLASTRLCVKA